MAGDDQSITRSNSQIAKNDINQRAATNDLAKRFHKEYFSKFSKGIPKLDDELSNYAAWMYVIQDVFKK